MPAAHDLFGAHEQADAQLSKCARHPHCSTVEADNNCWPRERIERWIALDVGNREQLGEALAQPR